MPLPNCKCLRFGVCITHQGRRHLTRFQCVGQVRELVDQTFRSNLHEEILQVRSIKHFSHDWFDAQRPRVDQLCFGIGWNQNTPFVGSEQ